jgi:hypothetical protein
MPKANRGWWRDYFEDHPGLITKQPEAYTNPGTAAKVKVYCKQCLQSDISAVQQEDEEDIRWGNRLQMREISVIMSHHTHYDLVLFILIFMAIMIVWTLEAAHHGRGWLHSATSTLLYHLRTCDLQSAEVQDQAKRDALMPFVPLQSEALMKNLNYMTFWT